MIKVLFVCLGNICRSPLAEAIFNHKVNQKGIKQRITSNSAGTAHYHVGEPPDPRTITIAQKNNILIDHVGQQFKQHHATEYDYLIAMDYSNRRDMIHEMNNEPNSLYQMRDFDPHGKGLDVPDPWYGGLDGFKEVFQILDRSSENLLNYIVREHDL